MNDESLQVPQSDAKDVAHIAVTTALSAIPFLGAGELFKFIVAPPLEKRREQWMETIAKAVQELQQKGSIKLESLFENEEFQTLLIEATQIALKTHLDEKRAQLKGVLIANAEGKATFDQASFRLRIIDQLLPVHIQILRNIPVGVSYPQHSKLRALDLLGKDLDKGIDKVILRALVRDLENLGLIRLKESMYGGDDEEILYTYERTNLGWL